MTWQHTPSTLASLLAARVIGMIAVYGTELRRVAGAPGRSVDPGSSEESVVAAGPQLDQ